MQPCERELFDVVLTMRGEPSVSHEFTGMSWAEIMDMLRNHADGFVLTSIVNRNQIEAIHEEEEELDGDLGMMPMLASAIH